MQFTNLITMIFTILLSLSTSAIASAIPVPSNTTATLSPLGRPYCTPTGPGVCNLAFSWWEERTFLQHDAVYVYDRYCNEIGSVGLDNMGTFTIFANLAFPIFGEMNPNAHFTYVERYYGDHCSYYGDGIINVKQCGFDCP